MFRPTNYLLILIFAISPFLFGCSGDNEDTVISEDFKLAEISIDGKSNQESYTEIYYL